MTTESSENQRIFSRTSIRASAVILMPNQDGEHKAVKAWTDDVSASGANILTEAPVADVPFCIRILMPGLDEQLLECVCVRTGKTQVRTLSNLREITRYNYGVKFVGVRNDPKLLAQAKGL